MHPIDEILQKEVKTEQELVILAAVLNLSVRTFSNHTKEEIYDALLIEGKAAYGQ